MQKPMTLGGCVPEDWSAEQAALVAARFGDPGAPSRDPTEPLLAGLEAADAVRLAASLGDPVFVCNGDGTTRWRNPAATTCGVAVAGLHLAASIGDGGSLANVVLRAARAGGPGTAQYLRARVSAGQCAVTVRQNDGLLAVLVRFPAPRDEHLAERLAASFGLEAEDIRAAFLVRNTPSVAACATAEGLSVGAFRSRLRRVFAALATSAEAGGLAALRHLTVRPFGSAAPLPGAGTAASRTDAYTAAALMDLLTFAEPALLTFAHADDYAWASTGARAVLGTTDRRQRPSQRPPALLALAEAAVASRAAAPALPVWSLDLGDLLQAHLWTVRPGLVAARLQHPSLPRRTLAWRLRHEVGLDEREASLVSDIGSGVALGEAAHSLALPETTAHDVLERVAARIGIDEITGLRDLVSRLRRGDGAV
jgi:hypothetical protein